MIVCSRPECQTTAGCTCSNRLFEYERLRSDNARLQEQLEAMTREKERFAEMYAREAAAHIASREAAGARAARLEAALGKAKYCLTKDSLCEAEKIDDALYVIRAALSEDNAREAPSNTKMKVPSRTVSPLLRIFFSFLDTDRKSYAALAKVVGISPVTLSRWKAGVATPILTLFEYVVEAAGYQLTLTKKEQDGQK